MGKSHVHNDDFAICAEFNNIHVGVVCDGCSKSNFSQIGSRMIAVHLLKQIKIRLFRGTGMQTLLLNIPQIIEQTFTILENMSLEIVLGNEYLDATIMISISDGNMIHWFVIGDGVVAGKKIDDTVFVQSYEYPQAYPHYYSYNLNQDRHKAALPFFEGFQDRFILIQNEIAQEDIAKLDVSNYIQHGYQSCAAVKTFFMATDGALSFGREPWYIAKTMLELKGTAGVFAERRARFIVTEETKAGFPNQDDFSGIIMEVE